MGYNALLSKAQQKDSFQESAEIKSYEITLIKGRQKIKVIIFGTFVKIGIFCAF